MLNFNAKVRIKEARRGASKKGYFPTSLEKIKEENIHYTLLL
jgi:hypothetical protein